MQKEREPEEGSVEGEGAGGRERSAEGEGADGGREEG